MDLDDPAAEAFVNSVGDGEHGPALRGPAQSFHDPCFRVCIQVGGNFVQQQHAGVGGSGTGDHPTFMALTLASDALKELGFNLIVSDMSNFSEMTNAINAGNADMFAMAWQATPDPDMFQIYHSKGGSNEKSYWIKDAELDDLIMQARQSTDQTYRKTLYKECLDIVADWAVEIPVYQRQNCIIISSQRVNLDTVTPDITTYWQWYNDLELLDLK